jgi:hypothetical protein
MLALYAVLIRADWHINTIIVIFGAMVAVTMLAVIALHRANQRRFDSVSLIEVEANSPRGH